MKVITYQVSIFFQRFTFFNTVFCFCDCLYFLQHPTMASFSGLLLMLPVVLACSPQKAGKCPSICHICSSSFKKLQNTLLCLAPFSFNFRLRCSFLLSQHYHRQRPRVSLWLGAGAAVPGWCLLHWNTQSGLLSFYYPRPDAQKPLVLWHTVWGEKEQYNKPLWFNL